MSTLNSQLLKNLNEEKSEEESNRGASAYQHNAFNIRPDRLPVTVFFFFFYGSLLQQKPQGRANGAGEREIVYLSLHCYHQNDSCIKMGNDENQFNVS